jgi:hypothetical protein
MDRSKSRHCRRFVTPCTILVILRFILMVVIKSFTWNFTILGWIDHVLMNTCTHTEAAMKARTMYTVNAFVVNSINCPSLVQKVILIMLLCRRQTTFNFTFATVFVGVVFVEILDIGNLNSCLHIFNTLLTDSYSIVV